MDNNHVVYKDKLIGFIESEHERFIIGTGLLNLARLTKADDDTIIEAVQKLSIISYRICNIMRKVPLILSGVEELKGAVSPHKFSDKDTAKYNEKMTDNRRYVTNDFYVALDAVTEAEIFKNIIKLRNETDHNIPPIYKGGDICKLHPNKSESSYF